MYERKFLKILKLIKREPFKCFVANNSVGLIDKVYLCPCYPSGRKLGCFVENMMR